MNNTSFVALKLSELRNEKGISQERFAIDLAEMCNRDKPFSISLISHYESGRKPVPSDLLPYIAKYYGVPLDTFIDPAERNEAGSDSINPSEPNLEISFDNLYKLDKKPVFVSFPNHEYEDQWGIYNHKEQRIYFMTFVTEISKNTNVKYYCSTPHFLVKRASDGQKPYDFTKLMNASRMWVEMISSDPYIQGQYNGWFRHNETKTCLINSKGQTLPYDGLGIAYNAYSCGTSISK